MTYLECLIYDTTGTFIGSAIMGNNKLQSTNIYSDGEEDKLQARIAELNQATDLKQHWPHPRDPEVEALLDDPQFHPLEMHTVQVVDLKNSPRIVYHQEAGDNGWEDSDEIDKDASELAYRSVEVPLRPTDQVARIKAACEVIARQRAQAATFNR